MSKKSTKQKKRNTWIVIIVYTFSITMITAGFWQIFEKIPFLLNLLIGIGILIIITLLGLIKFKGKRILSRIIGVE